MNSDKNIETPEIKRGRRRMELRRQQICDVSAQLFAQHGYQSTTLEMIAEELGYSKASLYHYVRSKEEVIALLTENLMQKLCDMVESTIPEDLPASERLRSLIGVHVNVICTLPESRVILDFKPSRQYLEVSNMPSVAAARHEYQDFVVELIQKGMDQGTFYKSDAKICTLLLFSTLNNFTKWYNINGPLTPDKISEQIAEIFIGGLMNPSVKPC